VERERGGGGQYGEQHDGRKHRAKARTPPDA
jgi:hypothetical protein